jgi:hypothetical protein
MRHIFSLAICVSVSVSTVVFAADGLKRPHQVVTDLRQQMYSIGETSGRLNDFVAAEQKAVRDIQDFIANGDSGALIEKNGSGQTPLIAAAYMGYSELVGELLKSDNVRKSIDDVNSQGVTAWVYTNLAFRQAMWVCNPTVFKNPFSWVPLFVTQPYYTQSPENPYRKTRRLLEEAGASTASIQAKQFWQDTCKLQDERTRAKVEQSRDILDTILAEGAETLRRFVAEQQSIKR